MSTQWAVLRPAHTDPSGPESSDDFARCTGVNEDEDVDDALGDVGRYDAGLPESTVNRSALDGVGR